MSATKKEDAMFLNETRLLVKNDKMPKKNKALDNINISYEPTDDNISLANKKENSLWLLNDGKSQRAEHPQTDFITKSNYDPDQDELIKEYNSQFPSSYEYVDDAGNKLYRKFLLPEFDVELDEFIVPDEKLEYNLKRTEGRIKQAQINTKNKELKRL